MSDKSASPAQISDEQAVKAVWPQARIVQWMVLWPDNSKSWGYQVEGTAWTHVQPDKNKEAAWSSARSRLEPVEAPKGKEIQESAAEETVPVSLGSIHERRTLDGMSGSAKSGGTGNNPNGISGAIDRPSPEPVEAVSTTPICGKFAGSLHPRLGLSYACVMDKDHDGECQRGGTCFKHGPYVGNECPQWPNCIVPSPGLNEAILKQPRVITTPTAELVPMDCPRCGSCDTALSGRDDQRWVECRRCDYGGPSAKTKDGAIAAWNLHQVSTPLPQQESGISTGSTRDEMWAAYWNLRSDMTLLKSRLDPALPQQEEPAKCKCGKTLYVSTQPSEFGGTYNSYYHQGGVLHCYPDDPTKDDEAEPIAPLLGQEEPTRGTLDVERADNFLKKIGCNLPFARREIAELLHDYSLTIEPDLAQALTSLAAARKELVQEQASSTKWAMQQAVHLHQIGLRINDDVPKANAWFNHRAEVAESSLAEAQKRIKELEKELGR